MKNMIGTLALALFVSALSVPAAAQQGADLAAKQCALEMKLMGVDFQKLSAHLSGGTHDSARADDLLGNAKYSLGRATEACAPFPEIMVDLRGLEHDVRGIEEALTAGR